MLEDTLYVLAQLFLIGLWGIVVVVVFSALFVLVVGIARTIAAIFTGKETE